MNKFSYLIVLMLLCSNIYAESNERDLETELADYISVEYADCAAFYSFLSVGFEASDEFDSVAIAEKRTLQAHGYSYQFALTAGRSEEMAEKVAASRVQLSIQEMGKEIQGDMSNISVLLSKYSDRCKKALDNPDAFMDVIYEEFLKMMLNK